MKRTTASLAPLRSTTATLDMLLLLVLMPAYIAGRDAYLVVVALLAYMLIALWQPLPASLLPETSRRRGRLAFAGRYALMLMMAVAVVVIPTLSHVLERAVTPVEADGFSPAYITLSDSALQTELALAYLLQGLNPYEERYEDTPLRFYQWQDVEDPGWQDPAYDYFVYLPGNLLISLPFYVGAAQLNILYDQRLVFLLFYMVLLMVLPHLAQTPVYKLSLVAGVGLNPLFTETVILGMNDVAVFLPLVLSVLMLTRRRFLWAAFWLGLACALKQYAWFAVPFFLLAIWQETPPKQRLRQAALTLGLVGGLVLFLSAPFFLWNPHAFYTDTLAFPSGRAALLYPIRGFTIGRLLMGAGIIPSFVAPFPFQVLQLLFGLPLLLLLLRYQDGRGVGVMVLATAVFIFAFGFLSRFFHQNYVGVVMALATLGILLHFSALTGQDGDEANENQPERAPAATASANRHE